MVFRGAMRTFNLMEQPGDFLRERKVQFLVLWTLLTGGKKNKASRFVAGPDREGMLALLEAQGVREPTEPAVFEAAHAAAS